jgi:protease I
MSEQTPATNAGTTKPAGEGVGDEELTEQVAESTDSNLEVEGAFERESGGAASDTEAAKATGDELQQ